MFEIKLNDYSDRNKSGVYKINFGPRFYIGCCAALGGIGSRINSHESVINALLSEDPHEKLPGSYLNIVYWLYAHPEIKNATVDVLEYYTDHQFPITFIEGGWIRRLSAEGLCLNKGQRQAPDNTLYEMYPIKDVDADIRDINVMKLYKILFKK